MNSHNCPCHILAVNHVQRALALEHLLRSGDPINPMLHLPLPTPQPRKIQDTPTQLQQLIFGNRTHILGIVFRMSRDPEILTLYGENARTSKLDPLVGFILLVVSLNIRVTEMAST